MQKFIALDEEGFFVLPPNIRLSDEKVGRDLLSRLVMRENHSITTVWDGETVLVEAFDKPLVAQQTDRHDKGIRLLFPYGFEAELRPEALCLDEWDRFHGLTDKNVPFVMSRKAQADFFNQLDEYNDDSVTLLGKTHIVPPFYIDNADAGNEQFWSGHYGQRENPPWDLDGPHPALAPVLPQVKIVKSRVGQFGCGRGHDAAFLAKQGHIVTGVDLSDQALAEARARYGSIENLSFVKGDVLAQTFRGGYDLIFEHTLFCAINPSRRRELIVKWHQALEDQGYLLGVFFVMPQRSGPPFGGSEWELRTLLEKHFRLLYWKRWEHSPERRQGNELVVFAQKISK